MQDNYRDKRTLLTAIRNSENAAFEHLYSAYYMMVSNYVKKNSGTEDDSRDIFQEVVFIFYKKLRGDPNFGRWHINKCQFLQSIQNLDHPSVFYKR